MLSRNTFDKALELLELGHTFPSITEETGITNEDAEAVHIAWFNGTTEQVSSELQLAGVARNIQADRREHARTLQLSPRPDLSADHPRSRSRCPRRRPRGERNALHSCLVLVSVRYPVFLSPLLLP